MAVLEILKYPDERLTRVSETVGHFDTELHRLLDDMAETMYAAKGIGIAAPQVGVLRRAFVVDLGPPEESPDAPGKRYEFINPVLSRGSGRIAFEEGCLSVPGYAESVSRKATLTVDFLDRFGKPHRETVTGLLAVAVQHENDHLDGYLFLDRLPALKRLLAKRRMNRGLSL